MLRFPSGRRVRQGVAGGAVAITVASLLAVAAPVAATPPPPPNPSNGQISAARNAKEALATQVGQLSGQIAQAQVQLQQLAGKAELAEQKYALAYSQMQQAIAAAAKAKQEVKTAQANVVSAHAKFVQYVQATYMSGSLDGTAGSLLTAEDPSALLEQSTLEQYQQQHQADAIGGLQRATIAKSNADAAARRAEDASKQAEQKAQTEKVAAQNAFLAQQQQKAALQATMSATQTKLNAAQEQLATLNNQRAQYLAYQAEQRRLAEERAARLARERAAAEAAARRRNSGGGGGSSGWSSGPSAPSGSWTAAKGRRAAQRAESQQGTPYAWAGGGAYGPSRGVCDPSNGAPNDCNVIGYDCSGLAMYAWGASWWAHYAATQYTQAGSYHPSLGNLMPGDLLFWSNGGISGIHHVAIYIGGGQIVQAPYSGGYVEISSMYDPGPIFGATRPFT